MFPATQGAWLSKHMAVGLAGGIAGAVLYKQHRVLGFLLGSMLVGWSYTAIDPPTADAAGFQGFDVGRITVRPLT